MDPSEIAFYGAAAGLIPILLLALAFQMTLESWWEQEEPVYRAIFPYYVGAIVAAMFAAEAIALGVLAAGGDFPGAKAIVIVGVLLPLAFLSLAVIARASDIHENFSWPKAFEEWAAVSERKRAAKDRRAAERTTMREYRRRNYSRWDVFKMSLRGIPPPPPRWVQRRRERKSKPPSAD